MSGTKKTPAAPAPPRRGPGRPPSKPRAPPLKKEGIVDSPQAAENRLEFVYEDPTIFKVLFAYFKNIKVREIHLRCTPQGLTFFARDHQKTSRVVAHVAGAHVNWHYCEGEYWLGINRDGVEKLFASIDKTFYKITILQTHEDTKTLSFVLKDAEIDKECNYKITLSDYARDPELAEAEALLDPEALQANFPVEFVLTAKQFKKSISDASNYSPTVTFEKIGTHPLQLTYAKPTMIYNEVEIRRLLRVAFELARQRRKRLTSVDKANILSSSRLWREVAHEVRRDYPDVAYEDVLVDAMAMYLLRRPRDFDVIATENMFGDILTDEASMLAGSMGLLASASLGEALNSIGHRRGMYEPIHGSAPDIAGHNLANPLATILSAAMMLHYSLAQPEAAAAIEDAVAAVLAEGHRTADIADTGTSVGCCEMGALVVRHLQR